MTALVTAQMCQRWRERVRDGDDPADIAEGYDVHEMTVREHVRGGCNRHPDDNAIEPNRHPIGPEECARIRRTRAAGEATQAELAEEYGVSQPAIHHHEHGNCDHDLPEV